MGGHQVKLRTKYFHPDIDDSKLLDCNCLYRLFHDLFSDRNNCGLETTWFIKIHQVPKQFVEATNHTHIYSQE